MNIQEIKGAYSIIYSLGYRCSVANVLNELMLRKRSGIFDWIQTKELSIVTQLLHSKFERFMEYDNLRYDGVNGLGKHLLFTDTLYDILIAHHYPLDCLQYDYLPDYKTYLAVQEKYNRRIKRLYEHMEEYNSILFIREGGTLEEIKELHTLLSNLVKGRFVLVVVNWQQGDGIQEERTGLDNVRVLSFNMLNIERWKEVLNGVSVTME